MKTKIFKFLKWALINCLFLTAVYMGFIEENNGAYNVAMFFAWFSVCVSFLLLNDAVIKAMSESTRSAPAWANVSFDLIIISIIAYSGSFITAGFFILHTLLTEAAWSKASDLNPNTAH